MSDDPWSKPSEVAGTRFSDFVGELVLIEPTAYEDNLVGKFTKPGETYDRVTANVTVIDRDNPEKSETHKGLYLSQGYVIGKTKNSIGGLVLATLTREKKASEADNPPYMLDDPSDDDLNAARKYLAHAGEAAKAEAKPADAEPPF